ncbi:hypothetical protein [Lentzea sp.]|nr:hypothetical protein [Lentzea sp.]HUQ61487.1 hypothetical protein [Lentzea sp.]
MNLHPADDLFSHPETHQTHVDAGSAQSGQPSWTNLFQEPLPSQRTSSES